MGQTSGGLSAFSAFRSVLFALEGRTAPVGNN